MAPRDSTETELDALMAVGARLSGFEERLTAEWIDGAFTALLAGPSVPAGPDAVLETLFGDTWSRTFGDPDDVAWALAPLQARWRVLRSQLDPEALWEAPDALRLSPLLLAVSGDDAADTTPDHATAPRLGEEWALGFRAVVDDPSQGWAPAAQDAAASEALTIIDALAWDDEALAAHLQARYRGPEPLTREQLVDDACLAVQDLRLWWIENAPRTAPRRADALPGRNDPCFCGSGRKFKKCHGAG